jgi:hypothetical protein
VVFLVAMVVYVSTLAPSVMWGDSASLAIQVASPRLFFGTAGDHPLFVLLGRLVLPLPGELAWKLNLLSAVFGALALAFVFAATVRLGGSRVGGAGAALALGLSHTFWHYSVMTGVRTLNALFLAALVWLLAQWRAAGARGPLLPLAALAFVAGLANHLVLLLALPGFAFFVLATRPGLVRGKRAWIAAAAVLAAAFVAVLVSEEVRGALRLVWYGPPPVYHYVLHWPAPLELVRELGFYFAYLVYQFPGPALVLSAIGVVGLWRTDRTAALWLLLLIAVNGGVFVKTVEWVSLGSTKVTFYLADYLVFAIFAGLGLSTAARRLSRPALAGLLVSLAAAPTATYAAAPAVTRSLGLDPVQARDLPFRDEARFFLTPSKRGDFGPRRYGEAVLAAAAPGSVIVADFTPREVLRYLRVVEGRRRDLVLAADGRHGAPIPVAAIVARERSDDASRPIYLADSGSRYYDLTGVVPPHRLERRGPLLELVEPPRPEPARSDGNP